VKTVSSTPSAVELARRIRARKVSPVEVAREHLERISSLNSSLNAFVDFRPELVMEQARAAERALMGAGSNGQVSPEIGPLHGVPLSIKSSINVAGHRCEAGSRLRAGYVAAEDAPLVARLRRAGATILGVSNTPEYLMAWETDNLLYGRTNNPWDLTRTAGGSSGGEAAAISAGLSAGGVGSDGGGSIRVPAHFCGICGLKPTPGRIPSTGHFPKSGGPFALLGVVGPMARTVEDLRVLFEVIAGWDDGDPCSAPIAIRKERRTSSTGLDQSGSGSIGFFADDSRTPVTAETRAAVQGAASALAGAGFRVEAFRPQGLEEARELWWQFFGLAGGMILGPMLRGREAELSPILREFCSWTPAGQGADPHSGESMLSTWLQRDELREHFLGQMRKYPVLICPVASIPAFRHGERSWTVDEKTVKYLDAWSYCEWFNLLGFPAAVVPFGRSAEGLPIGVQIVGRSWEEEMVLDIAAALENADGGGYTAPNL